MNMPLFAFCFWCDRERHNHYTKFRPATFWNRLVYANAREVFWGGDIFLPVKLALLWGSTPMAQRNLLAIYIDQPPRRVVANRKRAGGLIVPIFGLSDARNVLFQFQY